MVGVVKLAAYVVETQSIPLRPAVKLTMFADTVVTTTCPLIQQHEAVGQEESGV